MRYMGIQDGNKALNILDTKALYLNSLCAVLELCLYSKLDQSTLLYRDRKRRVHKAAPHDLTGAILGVVSSSLLEGRGDHELVFRVLLLLRMGAHERMRQSRTVVHLVVLQMGPHIVEMVARRRGGWLLAIVVAGTLLGGFWVV